MTTNTNETLHADVVMYATGRLPNTEELGLESTGVELSRNAIVVDEYSKTNVDNIYAVGDVVDHALTPVAIREGQAFAETLYNDNPTKFSYDDIPTAVFCQPSGGNRGFDRTGCCQKISEYGCVSDDVQGHETYPDRAR